MTEEEIHIAKQSLSEFGGEGEIIFKCINTAVKEHAGIAVTPDPHSAIADFGKHKYQVSIPKLCTAIAGLLAPLAEPKSPYCIGLAVIAAIVAFDGVAHRLTIEEAAVCQVFSDELLQGGKARLSIKEIRKRVTKLIKDSPQLTFRLDKALSDLEVRQILDRDTTDDAIEFREMVFLGWR